MSAGMGGTGLNAGPLSSVALVDVSDGPMIERRDGRALDQLIADLKIAPFLNWLITNVTLVSALVPDLASAERLDLHRAMRALRPTRAWGRRASTVGDAKIRYLARERSHDPHSTYDDSWSGREEAAVGPTFCQGQAILRAGPSPLQPVVIELVGCMLEGLIDTDAFVLRTIAG